jgi:phosphonate ABC transporter permease subunit PhnE
MKKKPSFKRSFLTGLAVVAAIIVLAYGFQVTKVNFEETQSEQRLTQLTRIIRALAHPNILEYDQEEVFIEAPVYLPCPEGDVLIPEPDTSGPYLILDPPCNDAEESIVVYGYNFLPGSKGPINFIPPSGVSLTLGNFETDPEGNFEESVKLPNFGTLLAIPLSFLAARNLMSDVKSPVASVALTIIGWLVGIAIGLQAVGWIGQWRDILVSSLMLNVVGLVVFPPVGWGLIKWALPAEESQKPGVGIRLARALALIVAALSIILATYLLANLLFVSGKILMEVLGPFSFIGFFIAQLGEVLRMIAPLVAALVGAGTVGSLSSRLGLVITERLSSSSVRILNFILVALAGAMLFAIVGAGIEWLYQINNPLTTLWIPAAIGAILGGILSLRYGPKDQVPIGSIVYLIMRTLLNAIRSIEPLIYVIIFVVWVGIGPFAGALALTLHTIAALAKLYSEQVESISPGPLEAVTATGANRLQTIIYAVVPQIIPPYISFTMYRWDINVRMSTIIGFAGGGGIGFLLQQNINLLDYRAAAVQMLAIAIVVASMDYTSALIRERFV